jgi:hypothetical protein
MKTFLKIFLIVVLSIVALKFIPLFFLAALVGLAVAAVLGGIGLALVLGLLGVAVALTLALSPLWIPGLIVLGAISLYKKLAQRPTAPPAAV